MLKIGEYVLLVNPSTFKKESFDTMILIIILSICHTKRVVSQNVFLFLAL